MVGGSDRQLAGLGPLEPLLRDDEVTEVMVNGPSRIYVEKRGVLRRTAVAFRSARDLEDVIQRIVAPLGRRIDQSVPFVDARLPDGSRVHAIIAPLAVTGPYLTIRKFRRDRLAPDELVRSGACTREMMAFLADAVRARCNVIVSGGSGSGKTTTLNALSCFVGAEERLIAIEDAAELLLQQEHVLRLEARPANVEGRGEVSVRTLLRNALRMRPDRLVIGEVRGGEAFDLIQAFNTGHEGCLATLHANSPQDAVHRMANMVLMAGEDLPYTAVMEQIAAGVDLVVHLARFPDGTRRVTAIAAVDHRQGRLVTRDLFGYRAGGDPGGVSGTFYAAEQQRLPRRLVEKFQAAGLATARAAAAAEDGIRQRSG